MQTITLTKFEGPLDLLLSLIEQQKLDITEIALAEVTEQYLTHIEELKAAHNLSDIAQFLEIASRLVLLKSRLLLPSLNSEEEEEIEDLKAKLLEYKRYKDAAAHFTELLESPQRSFRPDKVHLSQNPEFMPPNNLNMGVLVEAFQNIFKELPDEITPATGEDIVIEKITVEMKIEHIREAVTKAKKLSFLSLMKKARTKYEAIITFLAMLELIKSKFIKVAQDGIFSDITIEVTNA